MYQLSGALGTNFLVRKSTERPIASSCVAWEAVLGSDLGATGLD